MVTLTSSRSNRGSRCSDGDTIVAVSTPAGSSSRGIVRMSGPGAPDILRSVLPGEHRHTALPMRNYRSFATEIDLAGILLPARVYVMRAPGSYTREDIVEIHTFGCPALQGTLMDLLNRRGARMAEPGEFTRTAFLNGRLDLAQAEAVQALIHARTEAGFRAAAATLSGHLSRRIAAVTDRLIDLAAAVEASLDFAEHDIEIITREEVRERLRPLRDAVEQLLGAAGTGRLFRSAVRAVLFGPPNAGKSSVFNAILQRRRAIVSPHPGTTRDTIEAATSLNGIELVLVDTAGLRPLADEVESLAVSRSHDSVQAADIPLCVLDLTLAPSPETRELLRELDPERTRILLNKSDLGPCHRLLKEALPERAKTFRVCALDGSGLGRLLEDLRQAVERGDVDRTPKELMVNARQSGLLRRALEAMDRPLESPATLLHMDLAANDIREALEHLGELKGMSGRPSVESRPVSEAILDRIFSTFCIGK